MSLVEDCRSMDPRMFRDVLGHFPTGVVAITAMSADGEPVGMVVGSFTSASLDPPLVAYLPSIGSSSYAELREIDRFCVNVLSDRQEGLCRAFATKKGSEKFADATWTLSPLGSPVLEGAVAWIAAWCRTSCRPATTTSFWARWLTCRSRSRPRRSSSTKVATAVSRHGRASRPPPQSCSISCPSWTPSGQQSRTWPSSLTSSAW